MMVYVKYDTLTLQEHIYYIKSIQFSYFWCIDRVLQTSPLISEHFNHCRMKPHTHQLSILSSPLSVATSNLLFISVSLPVLNLSYIRNYIICDWLLSFSIIKAHPCCIACIITSFLCITEQFHYIDTPRFKNPLTSCTFGLFPFQAITNNAMSISVSFLCGCTFLILLDIYLGVGVASLNGNF